MKQEIEKLEGLISDIIVGYDDKENIELSINKLLSSNQKSLGLAESCTGGEISAKITSIPGASVFLRGGVVAYSVKAKKEMLQVNEETVKKHSVVSAEVATEMALGCQQLFESDYAIATTGIAGPTKADGDHSVGVVFIAIAGPDGVWAEEFFFGKPREKVIERASVKALEMLRKEIIKNQKNSLLD